MMYAVRVVLYSITVIVFALAIIGVLSAAVLAIRSLSTYSQLERGSEMDREWMSHLPPSRRLIDISMPGSHDALCYSWNLSQGGNHVTERLRTVAIAHWAETQSLNIYEQLAAGARYLDVRVGWHRGQWFAQHGTAVNYRVTYESALAQLRRFAMEQPREVIFWKLRTYDPVNESLHRLHATYLASIQTPTRIDQTIGDVWATGKNVMIVDQVLIADPYVHHETVANVEQARQVVGREYTTSVPLPTQLLVLQWIAAYNVNGTDPQLVESVRTISHRLNEAVVSHDLPMPPPARRQNVVMVDFLDARVARAIYTS